MENRRRREKIKTIIIYCDHWQNGGVESYIMNQLRHWDLSKIQCTVLSAEKTTDIYDKELQELGVTQAVLLKGENISAIFRILKTFRRYREYIRANPCDIIYLNLTNAVTMRYAKIAAEVGIKRRIVHSHNSGIQPGVTYFIKNISHVMSKNLYSKYATDYWACSDKAGKFLFPKHLEKRVEYIPVAIQCKKFSFDEIERKKIRTEMKIQDDITLIGTVGRCTTQKNQIFIIEVFKKVHQIDPNTRFILVGDGPLRYNLEQEAKALNISSSCLFLKFVDNLASLYSAFDIFCLPSNLEGNPAVAIEAQAAGCKCFLSETITKQAGVFGHTEFLPLKTDIWVERILEFIEKSTNIRNSRDSANEVVFQKGFDIVTVAKKIQSFLLQNEEEYNGIT